MKPEAILERFEALELHIAHQQQAIDDLSDALAEQWRTIETLRRQIARLDERIEEIQPPGSQTVPVDRPPHW